METAGVDRGLENFGSEGEWRNWGVGGRSFFFFFFFLRAEETKSIDQ